MAYIQRRLKVRSAQEPSRMRGVARAFGRSLDANLAMPQPGGPAEWEAEYRTRTDDPFLTMEVLYQLS
jgi:hypothetical protein